MVLTRRLAAAFFAFASLAIGIASIEAPLFFLLGMIGFLLLPLLMRVPLGVTQPFGDGTRTFTGRTWAAKMDRFARLMGSAAWGVVGAAALDGRAGALAVSAIVVGLGCSMVALYGLGVLLYAPEAQAESVTLDRDTLTLRGFAGTHVIRYRDIVGVEASGTSLWVTLENERHFFTVEPNAKSIAAAIQAACANAEKRALDDRAGATELSRPAGMGAREWLARIDALADAGRSLDAYRASGVDEERLLSILDSDGEDASVRAAAARWLASSGDPNIRLRVAERADAIRDVDVRARVKIVMKPDADEVAEEVDELELEALRREAGR